MCRQALTISSRKSSLEGSCVASCKKTAKTNRRQERRSLKRRGWNGNLREAYALSKQYSGKMKRCSPVLSIANGVAVAEAAIPIWRDHFKILLNRQAPDQPVLNSSTFIEPAYAVSEESPTESETLV
ncbi:hypothetical protein RB195_024299 [Necator americanus]|uniref:Uncharacterized protein n=1 Tax=Necator americanus TaxID=51031 RepID=A0ABR1EMX9_NECAM